jgi:hypothetical protein
MDEMNLAAPESEVVSEAASPSEEDFPPSSK